MSLAAVLPEDPALLADEIARVAAHLDAATQEMALDCTGAQLERICRRFRRVLEIDKHGERLDEQRFVRDEVLPSGLVRITAVLQPDEAALVMKAIELARTQAAHAPDSSAETPALLPLADALTKVAESFLAHGEAAGCGGDRHQIVLHLDQDVLAEDNVLAATLDVGTRVSAEIFRRIACDAGIVPMVHGPDGETLDVGRRTRTISPALRRALWARDGGCRFPGCTHRLYIHAHHIQHWAHGGPTSAENLVLLCSAHHRLLHEGGFTVSRSTDNLQFHDPRGRPVDRHPTPVPVSDWTDLTAWTSGSEIDPDTNLSGWDGRDVDYDAAVTSLLS